MSASKCGAAPPVRPLLPKREKRSLAYRPAMRKKAEPAEEIDAVEDDDDISWMNDSGDESEANDLS